MLLLSGADTLAAMVHRARFGVAPGARLATLQGALDELVSHMNEETSLEECLKTKAIELRQLLRQKVCEVAPVPTLPVIHVPPLEKSTPASVEEESGLVSLTNEEQEFVRRLLRISGVPLTKHQIAALDAVRSGNPALFERLEGEVAAESGEYRLQDEPLEGFAGTSGLGGEGLPRWDRRLRMDPKNNNAIFIALVTYRDPQCPQSLVEAFARAAQPNRVFIGVVQQNRATDVDCFDKYCQLAGSGCRPSQVRVVRMKDTDSRGVMMARWLASTLWQGEKWFLQVDAHSGFNYLWDEMVIDSILRTRDERAVLSHHPPDMATWPGAANADNVINICKYFWDGTNLPRFSSIMVNKRSSAIARPFPNVFIGAGMVFGHSQWIVDCPFDHYLHYLFSGEELLLSVCLFTKGWNVYNPDVLPVWHWYKRDIAGRENPQVESVRDKSILRLKYLLGLVPARAVPRDFLREVKPFLMGSVRTREQFWSYSGIDFATKKVNEPFCSVSDPSSARYHHHNAKLVLPPLSSYNFDTVPLTPLKYKTTAAPLADYIVDVAKNEPSLPKAVMKSKL